jgi:hypothetical protein
MILVFNERDQNKQSQVPRFKITPDLEILTSIDIINYFLIADRNHFGSML